MQREVMHKRCPSIVNRWPQRFKVWWMEDRVACSPAVCSHRSMQPLPYPRYHRRRWLASYPSNQEGHRGHDSGASR